MNEPTHLNCRQCVERLDDFVDRELTEEDMVLVEQHLAACVGCAREFRFEGAVIESIKVTLRRVQAPASLIDRIRKNLGS
jgi:anti-sigma factor (TIGR02949 family)